MWLIPKDTDGRNERVKVPSLLRAGLIRWYLGQGSEADHRASVSLVVTARENGKWLACDCLDEDGAPPLLSPAYLSLQETYYLRRLTSRPQHRRDCPFFLPQAPDRIREKPDGAHFEIDYPRGLFNAHKDAPEKLATKPDEVEPDDRRRGVTIPRLGKLLWMLLEAAGTNVIRGLPAEGRPKFGIAKELARLREAARRFDIAPGIPLASHLYTNAVDYERTRLHARLREAAKDWPVGYAPQAFLLLEASAVHSNTLTTGLGDVAIRNRIQQSGVGMSAGEGGPGGPYLALAVVGEHSKREGYLALRAYAQPIFKGNQFVPIERGAERRLFELLTRFQYLMRARRVAVAIKKPLFDILTDKGFVRPDAIVAFRDYNTGEDDQFAIHLIYDDTLEGREVHARDRECIAEIAPVLSITADELSGDGLLARLEAMIV
ncbi:hypothetical protein EH31_10240 [Erythrobacter longus]|uniref:DUF1173 domain-containing protein n=1 Tax=Erythrobacter longus TaxID=1044 RepID=A0A074MF21_ERYLO|nr:hypothetical protein [Erythrobacter longus]KEO90458.1 hypothetical protein EH31_10240 [Erythrobacter longus]